MDEGRWKKGCCVCSITLGKVRAAGHRSRSPRLFGIVIEVASTAARVRKVVSGGFEVMGG